MNVYSKKTDDYNKNCTDHENNIDIFKTTIPCGISF